MRKPHRFNLLIVHGDGTRVLRLNLPRWILYGGLTVLALAISTLGAIYGDYISLKRQFSHVAALQQQVVEQQTLIDSFHRRIAEVRSEVSSWGQLHAKIWEPFGPEDGSAKRVTGIGGGTGPSRAAETPDRDAIGDELERLTGIVKEEGDNLRALERFLGRATRVLAALPSRWPVRGQVNSGYGSRTSPWLAKSEFHSGLDIGAKVGTPVKSPAPGTVVFAGVNAEYGQTLIVEHGNETKSLYGHLSKFNVAVNQKVQRGDVVALTGNTGRSTGPHLHYEIQVKGQSANPTSYLWE